MCKSITEAKHLIHFKPCWSWRTKIHKM